MIMKEKNQMEMAQEEPKIPQFNFSSEVLEQGSEKWKELSDKVREACEEHGCFFLTYNEKIPQTLREEMFKAMESFFNLPEETKMKHQSLDPYGKYMNRIPGIPLRESLAIDDADSVDAARAFTNVMWPEGNPSFWVDDVDPSGVSCNRYILSSIPDKDFTNFLVRWIVFSIWIAEYCNVLHTMSSKMLELNFTIMKMIFDSYGLAKYYNTYIENTRSNFRPMKYDAPPQGQESGVGLVPHMDSNTLTILCDNGVQGLEILSNGHWSKVMMPEGTFLVIVGEMLKVWSNGKLKAVEHKVTMSGKKTRYTYGLFTMPKNGVIVEAPQEFIEEESPLLYRPFTYSEYITYNLSISKANSLEIFARAASNS